MKTIGILGGLSAASTNLYYRGLCALTQNRLGGLHSPELLIRSLDFAQIAGLQSARRWDEAGRLLNQQARLLKRGGADLLVLATNTMHMLVDQMMAGVDIPLVHIADATAAPILEQGLMRPALMATAFTMEKPFYLDRLPTFGLDPIVPDSQDRDTTHSIIYNELCKDIVTGESCPSPLELGHYIGGDRGIGHGAEATFRRRHLEAAA